MCTKPLINDGIIGRPMPKPGEHIVTEDAYIRYHLTVSPRSHHLEDYVYAVVDRWEWLNDLAEKQYPKDAPRNLEGDTLELYKDEVGIVLGTEDAVELMTPERGYPSMPGNVICTPKEELSTSSWKARGLPTDAAARKATPVYSGFMKYFPLAMAEVARLSMKGNEQHNPGQPLHWDRSKSGDELDAAMRHGLEAGTIDTDGERHSAKFAWRAMANLEKELEAANGA